MEYTTENPLYVVAIGAITNVASAILMNPDIVDRIVIVWLGGHAKEWPNSKEFNLFQDVAAGRIVFGCGAPLVQLPCMGVVSSFYVSEAELLYWLKGKNALCDYLVQHTIDAVYYAKGKPWTRVLWDVTAIAWLTGDFTESILIPSLIPGRITRRIPGSITGRISGSITLKNAITGCAPRSSAASNV